MQPPPEVKSPLNVLLLASCLTHWPLRVSSKQMGLVCNRYGPVSITHTFGEMFQTIEILRGQNDVPKNLRKLCHMSPVLAAVPDAKDFSELDVVLIEPSSPTELIFRGIVLNRLRIATEILNPIKKLGGKNVTKLTAAWLRTGLVGLDEAVRADTSQKLLEYVRGDSERAELARAVIQETRAFRSDIPGGFRKMRELFNCPMGAVSYIFRYMPDGRVISWPAGFREEVIAAARQSDLPIFDPVPMVLDYGIDAALAADSGHYSAAFLPVAGKAIAEFVRSVHAGSSPVASVGSAP